MQSVQPIRPCKERGGDFAETTEKARARTRLWVKRAAVLATLAVLAMACAAAALTFGPDLWAFVSDAKQLRAWVRQNELASSAVFVCANIAQVVIAFFPGEPLELAAGYAFGFWKGTMLCLLASALGTTVVVLAVRTLGMRVVNLFFSKEKIASLKWMREQQRFELLLFLCFLIPGTPKDLLTYAAGIGGSPLWRIVAITTAGRLPSIVSSTLAAGLFGSGNYLVAAVTAAVTVILVAAGAVAYRWMTRRKQDQMKKTSDAHEAGVRRPDA